MDERYAVETPDGAKMDWSSWNTAMRREVVPVRQERQVRSLSEHVYVSRRHTERR
jgi:hypothetical protein